MSFHVPNEFRIKEDYPLASTDKAGNNGAFRFHGKMFPGYDFYAIASDGGEWEHVSVSINRSRCPTWEMMQAVKELFWDDEDTVMQIHPPKSQYVNNHPFVLRLWRPKETLIPLPPKEFV